MKRRSDSPNYKAYFLVTDKVKSTEDRQGFPEPENAIII